MSNMTPRMEKCVASGNSPCKGRGVIVRSRSLKIYEGKEIEEAIPCPCRIRDMAEEWLSPLTKALSQAQTWQKKAAPEVDKQMLEEIRPDCNVVLDASKRGGLLWAKEALKAHLLRGGYRGMIPYRLLSEQEMDDYHFQREGDYAKLKDFNWQDYKLYIITLGNLPKSALVRYLAVRLNFLATMGARVWLIYHNDLPPVTSPENFCWSDEMSILTEDWARLTLPGLSARRGVGRGFADSVIDLSQRPSSRSTPASRPNQPGTKAGDLFGPNG